MIMSEGEIVRDYEAARYKGKQIRILAELNSAYPIDIARLLKRNGCELPMEWKKRTDHLPMGSPEHSAQLSRQRKERAAKKKAETEPAPAEMLGQEVERIKNGIAERFLVSDPDTEAPEIKSASVSAGSPEPAPAEAAGLSVGDLIAQLQGLPDGIRVTVGGGPVTTVAFVREYSARTGETRTEVILS